MTRTRAVAAIAAVLLLGLLAWSLQQGDPTSSTEVEPQPEASVSPPGVRVTLTSGQEELEAAVDAFLAAAPVPGTSTPVAVDTSAADAWSESQAAGEGPIDFAQALDQAIRANGPEGAARLLLSGMPGADERFLFVAAKTVAGRIDRPAATLLLEGLPQAPKHVRPHVVFALRGAAEPEVDQAFADLYQSDSDPLVRARAGSNLADRMESLDPSLRDRVLGEAREEIHAEDPMAFEAAADVLGGAPLDDRDRSALEAVVTTGVEPARRMAALRALATSGLSPAQLSGVLQQVRDDPTAGEALHALAQQLLDPQ